MQESEGLRKQIDGAVRFIRRRYGDGELILYFQAFSGTNAPAGVLKRVYDAALECAPFRELAVSTRPDCIDEEKADLLKSYLNPRRNVWVEMGLQSANDPTLRRISRGHTADDFLAAYRLLKERGIAVAVHLILGLPGETASDMENTARFVARLAPDGLKIHNLHIPRGTPLAEEYGKGEICAPAMERHLDYTILILERMPPETLIMRLTCDTPKNALCAPRHFADKHEFTARLAAEMRTRGTWQGRLDRAGAVGVDS
jgi:radical SAM protein (TIGR01212 family)